VPKSTKNIFQKMVDTRGFLGYNIFEIWETGKFDMSFVKKGFYARKAARIAKSKKEHVRILNRQAEAARNLTKKLEKLQSKIGNTIETIKEIENNLEVARVMAKIEKNCQNKGVDIRE
jgi:hypothetical protein